MLSGQLTVASLNAFAGGCPPTFRAEFLPAGGTPRCIDFILTGDGGTTETAALMFAGKEPLASAPGYVSDHIGLYARLSLAPGEAR